jgi:hypothetical protein
MGKKSVNDYQRLFLLQARSDFNLFLYLAKDTSIPHCHALHFLQMAAEKIAKAYQAKYQTPKSTHIAFVKFIQSLSSNKKARELLGKSNHHAGWDSFIRKCTVLARRIESLAPSIEKDGPNPEYPWPRDAPIHAPADYQFEEWREITEMSDGRKFILLLSKLFDNAETYF